MTIDRYQRIILIDKDFWRLPLRRLLHEQQCKLQSSLVIVYEIPTMHYEVIKVTYHLLRYCLLKADF